MTGHVFHPHILREYDIRGTYGQSLTEKDALLLGHKLGTLWGEQGFSLICIGRDGRLSSPVLYQNLTQGLRETGMNLLDVGVGPTPMMYFAVQETPVQAGIMITGSHNPKDDNGFKIALKDRPFFGEDIQNLKNQPIHLSHIFGTIEHLDVRQNYIKRLLQDYGKSQKNLTIAWDPGNGATGEIVTLLTQQLPGHHYIINETIDGTFPAHHPDPTEEKNLAQLRQLIQDHHCDLGIAFDGDGDRIGVIDEKGRILWGDQLLTLLGHDLLQHHPGARIIADVKSSQGFFDEIRKAGGQPIMGRTGHSLIKQLIKETGALLAGEMSGHIFFADDYYGYDDALYAAIRVLRMIENSPYSLAELYDQLPKFVATPELRIACPDTLKFTIIDQIANDLNQQGINFNKTDGVRVQTSDGWWLLRASNTQPVLVARCEAQTSEGLARLQHQMNEQVKKFLP
jgi:phosphomannomutase